MPTRLKDGRWKATKVVDGHRFAAYGYTEELAALRLRERIYGTPYETYHVPVLQLPTLDPLVTDGLIYFMQEADKPRGRIKIGFTSADPARRLKELQVGSASRLQIIALTPGTKQAERRLHLAFSHLMVGGEWFCAGAELLGYIDRIRRKSGGRKKVDKR